MKPHQTVTSFFVNKAASNRKKNSIDENEFLIIKYKATLAKKIIAVDKYNSEFVFLIDMNIPSGKKRFFVYDYFKDSIACSSLVAHGSGNKRFSEIPVFSNREGSGCSSVGKYKIGEKYQGRFGPAYRLYGLDTSNSNAFKRHVVLHSYYCVPYKETFPDPICNSLGCAMVAPEFLKQLQPIIDKSKKPILLWIFK